MSQTHLSEQEQIRRASLQKILDLGINPYPAAEYKISDYSQEIQDNFSDMEGKEVKIAGRMMNRRIMGKASFAELVDKQGTIQVYFNRDEICPGEDKTLYNKVFKKYLDRGDILGVTGTVFKTKMGEITVKASEYTILTKSVKPLPAVKEKDGKVYDAFSDPEQRYRQRYLDLIVNPQVKDAFVKRTKLTNSMREFLNKKDYMEVETPILQPIYGGAAARPFKTHHNSLDQTLYMRIANELYLKKLIVGGFEGVYEFAKDFRNEGMDRFHNPEFTQMELYVAYKDYNWMMDLVEEMVEKIAMDIHGTTKVKVGEQEINFQRPWKRYTMFEAIEHFTGIDISEMEEEELKKTAKKLDVPIDDSMGKGKLIDEIFGEKCEAQLIQPTFITDYPIEMSPLAKKHRSNQGLVERFEAVCNGKEICNAYSELNDPLDQRQRFEDQLKLAERGDDEAMMLDDDFLKAIEIGMPPTSGLGIGVDRLAMIMSDSHSIQDVIFFPQMKPEPKEKIDSPEKYEQAGIPKEWVSVLQGMGFMTVDALSEAKFGKLFNDLCGFNKKNKLGLKNPTIDEVKAWTNQ
ncbi:MAG: lysine--tRNA ligase [Bacteroidota bacterium]|nr:lysine--tRNA ligase [Bacteroidota bacterium]